MDPRIEGSDVGVGRWRGCGAALDGVALDAEADDTDLQEAAVGSGLEQRAAAVAGAVTRIAGNRDPLYSQSQVVGKPDLINIFRPSAEHGADKARADRIAEHVNQTARA